MAEFLHEFSTVEVEKYIELAKEGLDRVVDDLSSADRNCEGFPWYLDYERNDLNLKWESI